MKNYKAEIDNINKKAQRHILEKLLEDKPYDSYLAELKQIAKDKGYTDEWLQNQIVQLNKEYLELSEKALDDYNKQIDTVNEQYNKINTTNFEHNFSATDYADLQFLQTLIKTRIINESQKQPLLVERIVQDYINTQKGARAITFLANDNEVGDLIKTYYPTAYTNSQSPSEKKFNAAKTTELNKLNDVIIQMTQTSIIGGANVRSAQERVTSDEVAKADKIYF